VLFRPCLFGLELLKKLTAGILMLTFLINIYIYCFSAHQKPEKQLCVSTFSSFPQKPVFINPKANFSEPCLVELPAFQLEKLAKTNRALDRTLHTCSC
jgi:hypothetical protein